MRRLLAARLAEEQAAHRLPSVPDADVQYRAGSITKTFIAVAVLRLRDEGRVDLSDPVGRHVTDAGGAGGLAVGQLLSHTSGLRAETAGPWWERAAQSLGPGAPRLPPGWQFHYSNVGYALLGERVARLRGGPWYDVIADEL